jgi:hypothetical protein
MSATCPYCGGAIVLAPGANPGANLAQSVAQSSANPKIAHDSKDLSTEERKTYNQGYDQQFLTFWGIYPLRRSKRKAQIAWRKAVKRLGANPDAIATILAGAKRYRDDPNRDDEFTKYAEGWLNGDGWDDEPLPFRLRSPNGKREESPSPYAAEAEYRAFLEDYRAK